MKYTAATTANRQAGLSGNEDAYLVPEGIRQGEATSVGTHDLAEPTILAVSDGIHCSPQAKKASALLLGILADVYAAAPQEHFGRRLRAVHERFVDAGTEDARLTGMTATLVAAELSESGVVLYNVGDSPAWLIRDGKAQRLTRDHTVLTRMIDEGELSGSEPETMADVYDGLDRYFAALPGEDKQEHDYQQVEFGQHDTLVLASDGLVTLNHGEIATCALAENKNTAESLVAAAIRCGASDNVTVVTLTRVTD